MNERPFSIRKLAWHAGSSHHAMLFARKGFQGHERSPNLADFLSTSESIRGHSSDTSDGCVRIVAVLPQRPW
jgi:hypothetical protein